MQVVVLLWAMDGRQDCMLLDVNWGDIVGIIILVLKLRVADMVSVVRVVMMDRLIAMIVLIGRHIGREPVGLLTVVVV